MINKFNKIIIIVLVHLICFQFASKIYAASSPSLPNQNILRSKISIGMPIIDITTLNDNTIYPDNISIDMQQGIITGIIFTYSEKVNFNQIKDQLNLMYGKWSVTTLNYKNIDTKIWRITPDKFTISLTKDEHNRVKVVYLIWSQP